MTRLHREDAEIVVHFDEGEAGVLGSVAQQVAELLDGADEHPTADPAVQRLLPDAYPHDPEAAAEFRRYTRGDMAARKAATARTIVDAVGSHSVDSAAATVRLDAPAAERWLRGLADIRLALASRLGIVEDGDEPEDDGAGALYHWLGELQWALIETIEAEPA